MESSSSSSALDRRVINAAREGRADDLERLVADGCYPSAVDETGKSALHYAGRYGMLHCARALLAVAKQQIEARDADGNTPLHIAVETEAGLPVALELLKAEAAVNSVNKAGLAPIHVAAFCNNGAAIPVLVDAGADVGLITKTTKTPLHIAARNGNALVVDALLRAGADPTVVTTDLSTPLHFACATSAADVVQELIRAGASVNAKTEGGGTPVYYAASYGQLKNIELLAAHEADPTDADKDGRMPVHTAAVNGRTDALILLVQMGASVDVADKFGCTPLHYAAQHGHTTTASLLLQLQANIAARNDIDNTPLHLAASSGRVDVVQFLVKERADIHSINKDGETAIHRAARSGHAAVLQALIALGGPVNRHNNQGDTPLHLAASNDFFECVDVLLNANANTLAMNMQNKTPVDVAGPVVRPILEDSSRESAIGLMMTFGSAKVNDYQLIFFGESQAGKTALKLSIEKALLGRGTLSRNNTILGRDHRRTHGVQITETRLAKGKKAETLRTFDLGGHPDYRPLRAVVLRLVQCLRVLVVDLRDAFDELIAKARAWVDLALACQPRWQATRKMNILLVFGHADAVRTTDNLRTGLTVSTSAERLLAELLQEYGEVADFGVEALVVDCRVPYSNTMAALVKKLRGMHTSLKQECRDDPRVVEKVAKRLPKYVAKFGSRVVSWEQFYQKASKLFFSDRRDRQSERAQTFIRRITTYLHEQLRVIAFGEGFASQMVVLDSQWFLERVPVALLAKANRLPSLPTLTADDSGCADPGQLSNLINSILARKKGDILPVCTSFGFCYTRPDTPPSVVLPTWMSLERVAPAVSGGGHFGGRRLDLGKMTGYSFGALMPAIAAGLPDRLSSQGQMVVWPLGVQLLCSSPTTIQPLVVNVELAEIRGSTQLLVLTRGVAEEHICDEYATKVARATQQLLQSMAPSISVKQHKLSKQDLQAVYRSSTLSAVGLVNPSTVVQTQRAVNIQSGPRRASSTTDVQLASSPGGASFGGIAAEAGLATSDQLNSRTELTVPESLSSSLQVSPTQAEAEMPSPVPRQPQRRKT